MPADLGAGAGAVPGVSLLHKDANLIAGDFLQVCSHLSDDLSSKNIIPNTTAAKNVEALQSRNRTILLATPPMLAARAFGITLMEAVCRFLLDKPGAEIRAEDFADLIEKILFRSEVYVLN